MQQPTCHDYAVADDLVAHLRSDDCSETYELAQAWSAFLDGDEDVGHLGLAIAAAIERMSRR